MAPSDDCANALVESIQATYKKSTYPNDRGFISPAESLESVINQSRVEELLKQLGPISGVSRKDLVDFIIRKATKLLAILLVIDLRGEVLKTTLSFFAQNGTCDQKLPIDPRALGTTSTLACCRSWSPFQREVFGNYQWLFLAPRFVETKAVERIEFDPMILFPFESRTQSQPRQGGFGTVRRVKVHAPHLGHLKTSCDVAIKQLFAEIDINDRDSPAYKAWEREAKALQAISRTHKHIVETFAIFNHMKKEHFMFPWAERGNLHQFMATHSRTGANRDPTFVLDILSQLVGLASAIETMHKQRYRHGDLKPDNILIFTDEADKVGKVGVWKVADLGLAKFHNEATGDRKGPTTRVGHGTISYEPPETVVISDSPRSRLYDIWSMGCIILQLVISLLYGYEAVVDLTKKTRTLVGQHRSSNWEAFWDGRSWKDAKVHSEVLKLIAKIEDDFGSNNSSGVGALVELARLVRERLLVVRLPPDHGPSSPSACRARADELHLKLKQMHENLRSRVQQEAQTRGTNVNERDTNLRMNRDSNELVSFESKNKDTGHLSRTSSPRPSDMEEVVSPTTPLEEDVQLSNTRTSSPSSIISEETALSEGWSDSLSVGSTSGSATTFESQPHTSDIAQQVAQLLVRDDVFKEILSTGIQRTSIDKIKRKLHKLIRCFGKDLQKEANRTKPFQYEVAGLMQRKGFARSISQGVLSNLDLVGNMEAAQFEELLQQNEQRAERIESYLVSAGNQIMADPGTEPSTESLALADIDGSSSDDEERAEPPADPPKLSTVEDFITSSNAFETLKTKLAELFSSEPPPNLETEPAQSIVAHATHESPIAERLSSTEIWLRSILGFLGIKESAASALNDFLLRKLLRPKVPRDHQRITWICGCGKSMYSDVQEAYEGGAACLEKRLRRSAASAAATSQSTSAAGQTDQAGTTQGAGGSSQAVVSGKKPTTQTRADPRSARSGSPAALAGASPQLVGQIRLLILCVNGPRMTRYEHITVPNEGSDQELFRLIRDAYVKLRSYEASFHSDTPDLIKNLITGIHSLFSTAQKLATRMLSRLKLGWLVWWLGDEIFFVPKTAQFVRFRLVPVRKKHAPLILAPDLPPLKEVLDQNYHYEPCPSDVRNQFLELTFLHILMEPGEHSDRFWTQQVPKRLRGELRYEEEREPVIGWGIYITESPNWHAIVVLSVIFVVLSLLIAVIYSVVKNDASGGFTVGSFFLGAVALFVGLASTGP